MQIRLAKLAGYKGALCHPHSVNGNRNSCDGGDCSIVIRMTFGERMQQILRCYSGNLRRLVAVWKTYYSFNCKHALSDISSEQWPYQLILNFVHVLCISIFIIRLPCY